MNVKPLLRSELAHLDWIVGPVLGAWDVIGSPYSIVLQGEGAWAVVDYTTRRYLACCPKRARAELFVCDLIAAKAPDALVLLDRLEKAARKGEAAEGQFHHDTVRAVIGRGGRVWFTVNNGPRLYQSRAIEALDQIEATEKRRRALIARAK
jgi:hypothetical protein